MEILGDGPGSSGDELRPDRHERGRGAEGGRHDSPGVGGPVAAGSAGGGRRTVAASLDLGTMDLAPGAPGVSGVPDDEVWTAIRASAPASVPGAAGGAPATTRNARDDAGQETGQEAGHETGRDGAPGVGHAPHERDYRADVMGAVFSAPSLALAGLGISLAGLNGGAAMMTLYAELVNSAADAAPKLVAKALSAVAVLSAVLAFTSLRRMRAATPRWVATVAGATILLAVILLGAAGYFWWTASAIPMQVTN